MISEASSRPRCWSTWSVRKQSATMSRPRPNSLRLGWARYQVVASSRLGDVRKKNCRPFVLLYRVTDCVEILAVAHERSDWLRAIADF